MNRTPLLPDTTRAVSSSAGKIRAIPEKAGVVVRPRQGSIEIAHGPVLALLITVNCHLLSVSRQRERISIRFLNWEGSDVVGWIPLNAAC